MLNTPRPPAEKGAALRESLAHAAAAIAGAISPWWRFRLWCRLAGPSAYAAVDTADATVRPIWPHGYAMSLRNSDWMERYAGRSGRFYQDDLTALLLQEVRPGETFVDIGANIGFVTLTAARLVGPSGRVIAVEANPLLVDRLRRATQDNELAFVEVHGVALGDRDAEVSLVTEQHHGTSHLATDGEEGAHVLMKRGDDLIAVGHGPVFVKIDVEGAEVMVLRGLPTLRARGGVRWLIEISENQLRRFGATPAEVFALMADSGYQAFLPRLSRSSTKVRLQPLPAPLSKPLYDVLFLRPEV